MIDLKKVRDNKRKKRIILDNEWITLMIGLTNKCNLNKCITCPHTYSDYGEFIDPELFNNILTQIKDVSSIAIHGTGEPLFHPDVISFLKKIKRLNEEIRISTFSNGILLKKYHKLLIENGLKDLCVSLDAATKKTYKLVRRSNFDLIIKGIKAINTVKPDDFRLSISMVVNKINFGELFPFIELGKKLDVDGIFINDMVCFETLPQSVRDLHLLHDTDEREKQRIKSIFEKAEAMSKDLGVDFDYPNIYKNRKETKPLDWACLYPFGEFMMVDVNGDVFPCCGNYRGTIAKLDKNMSLNDVWNCEEYQNLRKSLIDGEIFENCKNCVFLGRHLVDNK